MRPARGGAKQLAAPSITKSTSGSSSINASRMNASGKFNGNPLTPADPSLNGSFTGRTPQKRKTALDVSTTGKKSGGGTAERRRSSTHSNAEKGLPQPVVTPGDDGVGSSQSNAFDDGDGDGEERLSGFGDDDARGEDDFADETQHVEEGGFDPNVMWLASRGTQCRTPDVDSTHPSFVGYGGRIEEDALMNDVSVFSINAADYNARCRGMRIDDDSDPDDGDRSVVHLSVSPSRRRVSYHAPLPSGTVLVRIGGRAYGFTDGQHNPAAVTAPDHPHQCHREVQTKDRRINGRTTFAPRDTPHSLGAMPTSAAPERGSRGGDGGATDKSVGKAGPRRRSKNNENNAQRATAAATTTLPPATAVKDGSKPDATVATPLVAQPVGGSESRPQPDKGDDGPTVGGDQPAPTAPAPSAAAGASLPSARGAALGLGGGSRGGAARGLGSGRGSKPTRQSGTALSLAVLQAPKDPSENYMWIDGIGNVPKRDAFYDRFLRSKPRPRPSSAAISAAMNQDDGAPAASVAVLHSPGPDTTETRPGSRADHDNEGMDRRGSAVTRRRDSMRIDGRRSSLDSSSGALLSPSAQIVNDEDDGPNYGSSADLALPAASAGEHASTNFFEVEQRKLPALPPTVRRALVPDRDGGVPTRTANPWADVRFSYDVSQLQPASAKAPSRPPVAPTSNNGRPAGMQIRAPPLLLPADGEARKSSLPSLGPEAFLDGPVVSNRSTLKPVNTARSMQSADDGSVAMMATASSLPATARQGAAQNDAHALKTQKQMIVDRDREFARLFPDWLVQDDRYRPTTKQSTRVSTRR